MPLSTIASLPSSQPASGCALCSVTPPWVAQRVWPRPVRGRRAVRADRRVVRFCEVADRADVVEPVALEQRDPGGVVAAVLEPFEARRAGAASPAARADVSDDSAHSVAPPFFASRTPGRRIRPPETRQARLAADPAASSRSGQPSSLCTSAAMLAQRSCGHLLRPRPRRAPGRAARFRRGGRARGRPAELRVQRARRSARAPPGAGSRRGDGTFCLRLREARHHGRRPRAGGRPPSAAQRSSAAASPSPVTWSSR